MAGSARAVLGIVSASRRLIATYCFFASNAKRFFSPTQRHRMVTACVTKNDVGAHGWLEWAQPVMSPAHAPRSERRFLSCWLGTVNHSRLLAGSSGGGGGMASDGGQVVAHPLCRSQGYTAEMAGVLPDGARIAFLLKVWCTDAGDVKWGLKRILSAFGFVEKSQNTKLKHIAKAQASSWEAWWGRFGFHDVGSMWGRSRHSMRLADTEASEMDGAEQEFWFSSAAFVLVALFWACNRRAVAMRDHALTALRLVLGRCLGLEPETPSGEHIGECPHSLGAGRCCPCFARAVGQLPSEGAIPQQRVVDVLHALSKVEDCPAADAHVGALAVDLVGLIDQCIEVWGDGDLLVVRGLVLRGPSGKRRRADPHLRQMVVGGGQEEGGARLAKSAKRQCARQSVRDWLVQHCAVLQAASHIAFEKTVVFSGAFDGARLGKPALELVLHVLWGPKQGLSSMLPPAVWPQCWGAHSIL